MKKHYLLVSILGLITIISCGGDSAGQQGAGRFGGRFGGKKVTSVEVKAIETSSISKQIKAFGTIQSEATVRVIPQVSNRIVDFYVDLGDTVKAGQKLAKIYDRTFRDQVLRDQANVQQARVGYVRDSASYVRAQKLHDQGLSSDAEYQTASATYQASKAQLATAHAALTQSRENLQNTEVTSPVNGVVISRTGEVGDLATTGQALFEIGNNSGYEIRLFLPLQDWELVRIGQKVDIKITNQPDNNSGGVVTRISPQLDAVTGLGEVVVTINKNAQMLYAGALTESRINVVTKNEVVTVPRSSLIEKVQTFIDPESNTIKLQRTYSLFVAQDTVAAQRDVELGLEQGDRVEILSGLKAGEKIVITGQNGLEDKAAIKVVDSNTFRTKPAQTIVSADSTEKKSAAQKAN